MCPEKLPPNNVEHLALTRVGHHYRVVWSIQEAFPKRLWFVELMSTIEGRHLNNQSGNVYRKSRASSAYTQGGFTTVKVFYFML